MVMGRSLMMIPVEAVLCINLQLRMCELTHSCNGAEGL